MVCTEYINVYIYIQSVHVKIGYLHGEHVCILEYICGMYRVYKCVYLHTECTCKNELSTWRARVHFRVYIIVVCTCSCVSHIKRMCAS